MPRKTFLLAALFSCLLVHAGGTNPPAPLTFRKLGIIPTGFHPKESIFSPDGKYVIITPLWDKRTFQVYDWEKKEMRSFSIPDSHRRMGAVEGVFTRDRTEYWFTQMSSGRVFAYSYPGFQMLAEIVTGGVMPKVVEFSPDGSYALVSNWATGDLTQVEVKTHKVLRRIPTGTRAPRGIAFTPDGRFAYVISFDSGHIVKFDTATWKIVHRLHTGGANDRIRFDREGRYAYIDNMAFCCFYQYDLAADRIVRKVPTGPNPNNVRLSPCGRYVYIAVRGPNNPKSYLDRSPVNGSIQVFRIADLQKIAELPGGNQCVGLDISPDGKLLVFSNLQDHTIHLYEISGNAGP